LESYDTSYSNRQYKNGTTTLQTVIPVRVVPAQVLSTDAS
jgi:hypothetical protein